MIPNIGQTQKLSQNVQTLILVTLAKLGFGPNLAWPNWPNLVWPNLDLAKFRLAKVGRGPVQLGKTDFG